MIGQRDDFLNDKDILCVNFFPLTDTYEKIKPSLFIISAPELWMNNVDKIYIDKREDLIDALIKKTEWPITILIPYASRKSPLWSTITKSNKNISITYYNNTGIEGFNPFIFWFFKKNLAMPRPHNILLPAIYIAINLKYNHIYIWGAENNQFLEMSVDKDNNALISQRHFYDPPVVKSKTMSKGGTGKRRVHEILHKFMLTFKGYHILKEYAECMNVKIINQTPGSMIDAFDREES